jgi:predicted oxidoreductase
VIIVGAGAAGTAAALEEGQAGLHTPVLDALHVHGGGAASSGGVTLMVDTPLQRKLGIADTAALALRDWMRWGGPEVDVASARRYIARSSPDLYEWTVNHGVEWDEVRLEEGNSVPRWHHPAGGGPRLMRRLLEATDASPVDWCYGVRVTSIVRRRSRVAGVAVDGGRSIEAGAVLVATGGFTNTRRSCATSA